MSLIGSKFLRYSLSLMPVIYMIAAVGIIALWRWMVKLLKPFAIDSNPRAASGSCGSTTIPPSTSASIESAELTVRTEYPCSFSYSGQAAPLSFSVRPAVRAIRRQRGERDDALFVPPGGTSSTASSTRPAHSRESRGLTRRVRRCADESGHERRGPSSFWTTAGDRVLRDPHRQRERVHVLAGRRRHGRRSSISTSRSPIRPRLDAPITVDFLPENGDRRPSPRTGRRQDAEAISRRHLRARRGRVDGRALDVGDPARGRAHDELGRARIRRAWRHFRRAGDALAVRRRIARLLQHVRAAGERQRVARST